jgi:hypothetical protein
VRQNAAGINRAQKSAGRAAQPWGFAVAAAAILCVLPALETVRCRLLEQGDPWVALRSGLWILEQRAVPRSALFTQLPQLSWTDSSWALDLLRGAAYRLGGLPGLETLQILLLAALSACVLLLCLTLAQRRWLALLPAATAIALLGLGNATVAPALFALELAIILRALHGGGTAALRVLPLLFVLWASVDATFLLGLALLLWLPCALALERAALPSSGRVVTPAAGALTFAISVLACMISPYGWGVYRPLQWAVEGHAYRYMAALQAQSFRHGSDFLILELLLLGFFALGRLRSRSLFVWGTMLAAAALSCAMQELRWSGIVAATAALALWLRPSPPNRPRQPERGELELAAVGTAIALLALALHLGTQGERMARQVAAHFPTAACQFIRRNALPQPLFHEYAFGSYLTFALPEYPVVIDGRAELYGDQGNQEFMAAMNGSKAIDNLDSFGRARTLLLRPGSQLAALIGSRADFTEVYRDEQAIVLLRRAGP